MRAMSLALMILFCTCHTAFAQSDTDYGCRCVRGSSPEKTCMTPLDCRDTGGRCVGIWPLPSGSYLWSCQSCKYDCSMLRCNCRMGTNFSATGRRKSSTEITTSVENFLPFLGCLFLRFASLDS